MLQIVDTVSVAASCQVCRMRILDKKNVKSNLGSGKYAYHYHIDCFRHEYGQVIEDIMKSHSEVDPVLTARANKPKPAWTIKRNKSQMTVRGPECQSTRWMDCHSDTPKLDSELQTTAQLLGLPYYAEICEQERLDNSVFIAEFIAERKITHIGFVNVYAKPDESLSPKAVYLVEGIRKK